MNHSRENSLFVYLFIQRKLFDFFSGNILITLGNIWYLIMCETKKNNFTYSLVFLYR